MGKEENNQIDLYINQVSRLLPYPKATKKEALDVLRIDVQSAMEDSKGESPFLIFGDPLEVAKNICQGQDWCNNRANWLSRLFAWMLDLLIKISILVIYLGLGFLFLIIMVIPFDDLMQEFSNWEKDTSVLNYFSVQGILLILFISFLTITTVIIVIGYNATLEYYFGATIGKKLLKIKVVDQTGVAINWKQAIIRNLSKLLVLEEILPFDVVLGMILGKLNPEKTRNQRGLDILAETIVIKQK
jgi:uncharacterized RDD family membrane protein YckC